MKPTYSILLLIFFCFTSLAQSPLKVFEQECTDLIHTLQKHVVFIISSRDISTTPEKHQIVRTSFSGVVFDKKGYILTIGEAIRGTETIHIELVSKDIFPAKIVGLDEFSNVGILKIEAPEELLFPVSWGNSDDLKLGSFLFTLGNAYDLNYSLSIGQVSGLGRFISPNLPDMIQMTNNINPGDPGGLVANSSGEFVGMMFTTLGPQIPNPLSGDAEFQKLLEMLNSFEGKSSQELVKDLQKFFVKFREQQMISPILGAQGINFFLPSNRLKFVTSELIKEGVVRRGKLGIKIVPLTIELRKELTLSYGVKIEEVAEPGPAFQAGVRTNDILLSCNQVPIKSTAQVRNLIQESRPGTQVELELIRNNQKQTLLVTLGE